MLDHTLKPEATTARRLEVITGSRAFAASGRICLIGRGIENIEVGSEASYAGALRNGDDFDRADVRFARPDIQIYDAHVGALYQRVCARYLVGVKGAEAKAKRS